MGVLSRHQVASILEYLDAALLGLHVPGSSLECDSSWRIRMARKILLDAAVASITVEVREAA